MKNCPVSVLYSAAVDRDVSVLYSAAVDRAVSVLYSTAVDRPVSVLYSTAVDRSVSVLYSTAVDRPVSVLYSTAVDRARGATSFHGDIPPVFFTTLSFSVSSLRLSMKVWGGGGGRLCTIRQSADPLFDSQIAQNRL